MRLFSALHRERHCALAHRFAPFAPLMAACRVAPFVPPLSCVIAILFVLLYRIIRVLLASFSRLFTSFADVVFFLNERRLL